MRVQFFALLRKDAGTGVAEVSAGPATAEVGGLVAALSARFGPAFDRWVLDENRDLRPDIIVLVNGRNVRFLDGLRTPLKEEDEVAIFPPVAGG